MPELHINPKTNTPYSSINHFTFVSLSEDIQNLYTWAEYAQRYIYVGKKEERTNDAEAL